LHERGRIRDDGLPLNPDCDECEALEDSPIDFVEQEFCPICPWGQEIEEPIVYKLMDYIGLQSAGCPIGRHELTNEEWRYLGIVKTEIERLAHRDAKAKRK
jgi:hypothetical protein